MKLLVIVSLSLAVFFNWASLTCESAKAKRKSKALTDQLASKWEGYEYMMRCDMNDKNCKNSRSHPMCPAIENPLLPPIEGISLSEPKGEFQATKSEEVDSEDQCEKKPFHTTALKPRSTKLKTRSSVSFFKRENNNVCYAEEKKVQTKRQQSSNNKMIVQPPLLCLNMSEIMRSDKPLKEFEELFRKARENKKKSPIAMKIKREQNNKKNNKTSNTSLITISIESNDYCPADEENDFIRSNQDFEIATAKNHEGKKMIQPVEELTLNQTDNAFNESNCDASLTSNNQTMKLFKSFLTTKTYNRSLKANQKLTNINGVIKSKMQQDNGEKMNEKNKKEKKKTSGKKKN